MSTDLALDLLGYLAAAFIAIGLTRTSVLKLRLLNLAGGVTFVVYGFAIGAMPVALTNLVLSGINVYFLLKLRRPAEVYSLLEVAADSAYLRQFLEFYREDIARFMPHFSYVPAEHQIRLFILRDMLPVGLFIGDCRPGGTLEVGLDYATPGYRDLGVARYLYGAGTAAFDKEAIETLESPPGEPAHERYLRRVGYERSGDRYVRRL